MDVKSDLVLISHEDDFMTQNMPIMCVLWFDIRSL